MAGDEERRRGFGGQMGVVPGERFEGPFTSWELGLTSVHRSRFGDHIVIGRDVSGNLRRALAGRRIVPREPGAGETWRLSGHLVTHADYGQQLHAVIALPLMPDGRAIVKLLATSDRFPGIGWATAEKLWTAFGGTIYEVIRERDLPALSLIVGPEKAISIVDGFGFLSEEVKIFEWLDRYGVSPRIAGAAARIWGGGAIDRIQSDPYCMTIIEPWEAVDKRALRIGFSIADRLRLSAAVEHALAYRYRLGHMAVPVPTVSKDVHRLLSPWKGDPKVALTYAIEGGRAVTVGTQLVQSRAARFMEDEIAKAIGERTAFRRTPDMEVVQKAIAEINGEAGYDLTPAQRAAVNLAASGGICLITGGAGTGKTTVVRCILNVLEKLRDLEASASREKIEHLQVALAGRAVRRISEATGRPASTLARLIHELEDGGRRILAGTVIFDEASMLDTPTLYRLLIRLPREVNLIFVGDIGQLQPIGPGNPFEAMISSGHVPSTVLNVVHRQDARSGIPQVALAIRNGTAPELAWFNPRSPFQPGVFLFEAPKERAAEKTLEVFRAMCGVAPSVGRTNTLHERDVQVLAQTKHGQAGSRELNRLIEAEYMADQPKIDGWGLSIGSKVIWLRNDYMKSPQKDTQGRPVINPLTGTQVCAGFMNGSIGTLVRPHTNGVHVIFDDGAADDITEADLVNLTHGWAVSVHKAQGSAFRRVIIPIVPTRVLDRALLYTAVTRAIETVVLVGEKAYINKVVMELPRSVGRHQALRFSS